MRLEIIGEPPPTSKARLKGRALKKLEKALKKSRGRCRKVELPGTAPSPPRAPEPVSRPGREPVVLEPAPTAPAAPTTPSPEPVATTTAPPSRPVVGGPAPGGTPAQPSAPGAEDTPAVPVPSHAVQVGAFRELARAERYVEQLQQAGYGVRRRSSNGWHRVQVGPYPSRAAAETVALSFQELGLPTLIVALLPRRELSPRGPGAGPSRPGPGFTE